MLDGHCKGCYIKNSWRGGRNELWKFVFIKEQDLLWNDREVLLPSRNSSVMAEAARIKNLSCEQVSLWMKTTIKN